MGLFDIFKSKKKDSEEKAKKQNQQEDHGKKEDNNSELKQKDEKLKSDEQSKNEPKSADELTKSKTEENSEAHYDEKNRAAKVSEETEDKQAETKQTVPSEDKSQNEDQRTEENDDEPKPESNEKAYEHGLAKSRSSFGQKLNALFANFRSVDDNFFDDLEDTLIESDVGFETAIQLTDELKEEVKLKNAKKPKDVQNLIVQKMIDLYDAPSDKDNAIQLSKDGPTVILFVGVNGVGKTTTIGKMANNYKQQGKKVLMAAADTFRAGAIEQLDEWAKRDGVDIVKKEAGSDPASVVFEAVDKAKKENYDVLFVDTAGRLQNKVNLMNELAKINKVIKREIPAAPQEVLLVIDATTGQNALNQAKMFNEITDITGIVLTKLDGTAKGGIVIAIKNKLNIPVKFVGLGETVNDLRPFDSKNFIDGLFKGLIQNN
ncbi:signal recognition particle-docking protein FtsY [Fructilactobacillus fructivorans]|uniref:signal recognition particle-docking protein FtsY n=1 Tax=Fructilactobacillus fructivorans TaxID=1614 RepID=UPI0007091968|nr:signal recognition particle-docking protein FtsY [Fructilactobacillus fructivorans]KRN40162.1 signal recognition particle-docking protein FtsY [Fructilactobacillus fructivorans]